ncbi:hypothetical protein FA95DRAFT_1146244 [Auriscalpium vulgare]|uniref:Uncharacterized protein n=1 Tax=Auriscalpium vulgare TaxID=40419 RepID=A0ACB8RWB6_9AGAM|nr:hypothetical protein FA95DRAFT_1146244 [Auriscalpium vulgare]
MTSPDSTWTAVTSSELQVVFPFGVKAVQRRQERSRRAGSYLNRSALVQRAYPRISVIIFFFSVACIASNGRIDAPVVRSGSHALAASTMQHLERCIDLWHLLREHAE